MRNLLFFLLLCSLPTAMLTAQHKDLAVDLCGQKGSNWCWAASMTMVMRYHQPTIPVEQCELASGLMPLLEMGTDCTTNCLTGCITTGCNPGDLATFPCDYALQTSYLDSSGDLILHEGYFDAFFSDSGYYSMEDHNLLSWDQYKFEIDNCRPVILLYNVLGNIIIEPEVSTESPVVIPWKFDHAAVGKGYTQVIDDASVAHDYFIVNDPWKPCYGETYLLSKNALTGSVPVNGGQDILEINDFKGMVHHISPKTDTCTTCDSISEELRFVDIEDNRLLAEIRKNSKEYAPVLLGAEFSLGALEEVSTQNHYFNRIAYFSYDYFNNPKVNNTLNYGASIVKTDAREVVYTGSEGTDLISRIRCDKGNNRCAVETIGLQETPPGRKVDVPGGDAIYLNNDPAKKPELGKEQTTFTIVRYPGSTFEFYRFNYKGEIYYYPTDSYAKIFFYGKEYADSSAAISEKKVLQGLAKYTQNFSPYKLPEKSQRKQKKFQEMLEKTGYLKTNRYLKRLKF